MVRSRGGRGWVEDGPALDLLRPDPGCCAADLDRPGRRGGGAAEGARAWDLWRTTVRSCGGCQAPRSGRRRLVARSPTSWRPTWPCSSAGSIPASPRAPRVGTSRIRATGSGGRCTRVGGRRASSIRRSSASSSTSGSASPTWSAGQPPRPSELSADELRAGGHRLRRLAARTRPHWIAVVGVTAYRSAFGVAGASVGAQDATLGPARLWVLPNPSGLNAHVTPADLATEFARFREAVG